MKIRSIAIILCLSAAALAQTAPTANPNTTSDKKPIAGSPGAAVPAEQVLFDADRAFCKATIADRVEGWMRYMADDVVLFNISPPIVGKEAVRKFYEPVFANPNYSLQWEPKHGEMQPSGMVGYTTGRYTMKMKNAKGEEIVRQGSYLTVWKKQPDGSWKVIADGGSPDTAPIRATRSNSQ